jgi:hypothetical protein
LSLQRKGKRAGLWTGSRQAVRGARGILLVEDSLCSQLAKLLTDFAETAALMCCLDLLITVDISVAHLAGSLACPAWILLPDTPDYRWLLDRDDSPWYPTARLFRQNETREYASVIVRMRRELEARIAACSGQHGPA